MENAIQRFAEDTVLHGYKQLFLSKSLIAKIFWTILLVSTCLVALTSSVMTVIQYNEQPNITIILPLNTEAVYPPLQICRSKWFYWIDWDQLGNFNLDRDTTLYAMSFFDIVYSSTTLDLEKAREKLEHILRENNLTLYDLYLSISYDVPLGFESAYNYTKKFSEADSRMLCYSPDISWIRKKSEEPFSVVLYFEESYNKSNGIVSVDEYLKYVSDWMNLTFDEDDLDTTKLSQISPMLFVDGSSDKILINDNFFEYHIRLTGSVYKRFNSVHFPCDESMSTVQSDYDDVCRMKCDGMALIAEGKCVPFKYVESIGFENVPELCLNEIIIINETRQETLPFESSYIVSEKEKFPIEKTNKRCSETCLTPCKQWMYGKSVSKNHHPKKIMRIGEKVTPFMIEIKYPSPEKILLIVERHSVTLDILLSDIGGTISLWLGASVVSIFQLFYLCCFSSLDNILASSSRGSHDINKF